jgi:flagellar biosynthesis component FlhA
VNKQTLDKVKSFVRHFAITAVAVYSVSPDADWKAVLAGAIAGVVGPAIRAIDKNDPAFGKVATWAETEIKKVAKKTTKKKA